jgi:hypothetical protein
MSDYMKAVDALVALAHCIPNLGVLSVQVKHGGYVTIDLETEAQAHDVAKCFGAELTYVNSRSSPQRWLHGRATHNDTMVVIYGPHVAREEAQPLDGAKIDEATAQVAEVVAQGVQ